LSRDFTVIMLDIHSIHATAICESERKA
jgi:hypothetical protein